MCKIFMGNKRNFLILLVICVPTTFISHIACLRFGAQRKRLTCYFGKRFGSNYSFETKANLKLNAWNKGVSY